LCISTSKLRSERIVTNPATRATALAFPAAAAARSAAGRGRLSPLRDDQLPAVSEALSDGAPGDGRAGGGRGRLSPLRDDKLPVASDALSDRAPGDAKSGLCTIPPLCPSAAEGPAMPAPPMSFLCPFTVAGPAPYKKTR